MPFTTIHFPTLVTTATFYIYTICLLSNVFVDASLTDAVQIKGIATKCSEEGKVVNITQYTNGYSVDDPCLKCFCLYSEVHCSREQCAPSLKYCPVLEPRYRPRSLLSEFAFAAQTHLSTDTHHSQCCPKCRTCFYAGARYESDERWLSTQDACRTFVCKAGVITIARMRCALAPCDKPIRVPGYCCPVCPTAKSSALTVPMDPTNDQDASEPIHQGHLYATAACVECHCDRAFCQCYKGPCPALDCAESDRYQPTDSCCPQCRSQSTAVILTQGNCFFQGQPYAHEQAFRPDQCTLCKCQDGVILCKRFVCPTIQCARQRIYYDPRVCCPFCRNRDPDPCTVNDVVHKHGSRWHVDDCTTCVCTNGATECSTQQCPIHACPPGYRERKVEGQCCHECEEEDATCTVDGNRFLTFDGVAYNFAGSCRYVLMETCHNADFQPFRHGAKSSLRVLVRNRPRKPRKHLIAKSNAISQESLPTNGKSVLVRLHNAETNRTYRIAMLRTKRIKINSRTIRRLPHLRLGLFTIQRVRNKIVLRIQSPETVRLEWDGVGWIHVTADRTLRARLCGLCGNYNQDGSDDLDIWMRPGDDLSAQRHYNNLVTATSVHDFAQSWRTGSWRKCSARRDRLYHLARKRERRKRKRQLADVSRVVGWRMLNQRLFG